MSQNPLLQQLVSPITIRPEDCKTPEQTAKIIRLVVDTMGASFQRLQNLVNTDPRMSDTRIAHGVTTQQGDVTFDYATLPLPGDVPYAVDGGRRAIWGSGATPGPTGGGVGPSGVSGPLLDANHNTDTVAQSPTRGSIVYANATPKWDELVKGSDKQVLGYNATDILPVSLDHTYLANRTMREWLPIQAGWVQINGTVMSGTVLGTYPDTYQGLQFVDAPAASPQGIMYQWRVPKDWASGTVEVKMLYRMIAAGAGANIQFEMRLRTLAYAAGASPVGAATTVATTVTNPAEYVNTHEQSLGTITVSADNIVRIVIDRNSAGSDDSTDTVNVIGVSLEYTADS